MTTLYAKPFHKKMRRLFCLLAALLVFAACDKPKNIPDDKLTAIVGDLFLANAYWDIHGDYRFIRDSIDIYSPIFEQYGFTPKDFMFTIENLSKRKSVKFTDILQAALDTLQAGGRPWFDAIARRDSVNKIAAELFKKQVYFDSATLHAPEPDRGQTDRQTGRRTGRIQDRMELRGGHLRPQPVRPIHAPPLRQRRTQK